MSMMLPATELSRCRLQTLVDTVYSKCVDCPERAAAMLLVLPCLHVVCRTCVHSAMQRAAGSTTLPANLQTTKYRDPRRFECPVCSWPQYAPLDAEGHVTYPNRLPLHAQLLSAQSCPSQLVPPPLYQDQDTKPADSQDPCQGGYIYESSVGTFGSRPHLGQMRRVGGMALDLHHPSHPLLVVSETASNVLLSFRLSGKLEQARPARVRIRDICIAEKGTVVAAVAEESYALAKWDSALTVSGVRHENLFRHIYGHSAQIQSEPFGVCRDVQGRFLVTMLAKDRVCVWDEGRTGDHISWFGDTGRSGTGLLAPYYVTKLSTGLTVVSSTSDHKVKVVDDVSHRLVAVMGGLGCGHLDLCFPHGVCVDEDDNIFIADTGNFRVVVYSKNGDFLSCAVSQTWNYGSDVKPTNMALMRDGRLLVMMQGREYCQVHVYRPRTSAPPSEDTGCHCNWTKCWSRCVRDDYDSLD